MVKKRIDPDDGTAYTWEEMSKFYRGKYKQKAIEEYWYSCKEVGEKSQKRGAKSSEKAVPKARAKSKGKKEAKPRKPRIDAELLEAALKAAKASPAKTVELLGPLDEGMPGPEHFKIVETPIGEVPEGGLLLEVVCMSADPYMRSRIKSASDAKAGPISGYVSGRILESKSPKWHPGDLIGARLPYTTVQVVNKEVLETTSIWRLTGMVNEETISQGIGVLGMPGSTAYGGFIDVLKPKRPQQKGEQSGEVLFVSAASGAVGQLVGQLAKNIYGCTVIGSAGGPEKCATIKEKFGYDYAIDYKTVSNAEELAAKIKECSPDGIDMYFENVGGMHFDAALSCLKTGGRIAICGCISQYNEKSNSRSPLGIDTNPIQLGRMIYSNQRIEGFICRPWLNGERGAFLRDMKRWLKQGKLNITETVTEGIEKWPEAFQSLFTGKNNGKVVVQVAKIQPLY
eukprot:gnl/MRDRNA2_/MRDRNA2_77294_c0_seq2.p1 gnl/MRDRNA2_/MRDRNA2_77294_c0~~gnl/MRDRNA2_/MRDRNA2_77294_c0_seq2.p1  ORF type:complete len:455 (+),score=103.45 gnl/MRDRNA2_/MRDRNA2_77294_c0_seq2:82-1446(+)